VLKIQILLSIIIGLSMDAVVSIYVAQITANFLCDNILICQ
jgi:hypothetical protein